MMEFFNQYPVAKLILAGFGVLYLLDKYLGFSPIDKLIDLVGSNYKFKTLSHLNNPKIQKLIEDFNNKNYSKVESTLKSMSASYRSFGFKSLGEHTDVKISNQWIEKDGSHSLPRIIKAYQLIHAGWEIRGRGYIDSVSESDLANFKDHLKQAEYLLIDVSKTANDFQLNIASALLKVYKSIDVERETIYNTFKDAERLSSNDAELNFNYFSAISPKWGGTEDEFNTYFNALNNKSVFIQNLIKAQYYFDLVHMEENEDKDGKIAAFVNQLKNERVNDQELYIHELHLLLYWISNNLNLKDLEKHYKNLLKPYWAD